MQRLADEYAQGHKPTLFLKADPPLSRALGYVVAIEEVCGQIKAMHVEFDHIISAVGSANSGRHVAGQKRYGLKAQIHGINVCDDAPYFQGVSNIIRDAKRRFGFDIGYRKKDVDIIDGYVGKGYGEPAGRDRADQASGPYRRHHLGSGLHRQAMYGLIDQIRKGRFAKQEKVLFGTPAAFLDCFEAGAVLLEKLLFIKSPLERCDKLQRAFNFVIL
jgi:D-cysteine desulfhydrase